MNSERVVCAIEAWVFRHRLATIIVFALATLVLGYQATHLKLDAAFTKNIPLNHQYMQTYLKHQKDFGGANNIYVSVCDSEESIFNQDFMNTLKQVHDQVFFIPGVNRSQVKSLFSPSTRFTEVVEDGFAGGPVIPADFNASSASALQTVEANVEKAGIVGRMVANDYSCAMVTAQLLEVNPDTGEKLDTLALAEQLENDLRGQYEKNGITLHIIGFAKVVGDVADGAKGVVLFFLVAIAITALMVYFFSRSIRLTLLPLATSLMAVVWQIGSLTVIGFGLDPMSILVPFLVFAIGVSHGVQMINSVGHQVNQGICCQESAQCAFRSLLIPGGIALLSDTVGFLTLLAIDIGIIRELAITASLGVGIIILTNLVLLPILLSYLNFPEPDEQKVERKRQKTDAIWATIGKFADPKVAPVILAATAVIFTFGYIESKNMKIGDLQAGAPQLHEYSRYNQDTFLITERFEITVDYLSVLVETTDSACTEHKVMSAIDQFQWQMENVDGVLSAISLASIAKQVNAGYNEGNPKWRVIPRTQETLVQAVGRVPTSSGLLNGNCSVMPVILFMSDHKAETIAGVVKAVKEYRQQYETDNLKFKLASGPNGVMAATNEAVQGAQTPMMFYVYGAVIFLCLLSFRSLRATISVVLPLFIVSTLAQALMVQLDIGLTVSTLPVIALGVGIGVDYGIYILSTMSIHLRNGVEVKQAYIQALKERGNAVLFTGLTLAIGVSTWFFSALKFQVDMGILLTFMFMVNMLAAIVVLPAIAAIFWRKNDKQLEA